MSQNNTSPNRGQFFRVEKFAVQAPHGKSGGNNLQKVACEAARIEGFCPHVEKPLEPVLVWGDGPMLAASFAREWSNRQTVPFLHKPSQTTKIRKYRDDQPSALVGVISVPPEWVPGERWARFVEMSLRWLLQKYGHDRLKSVIEHHDEDCLHLHFWAIPRPAESFSDIHPGEKSIDVVGRKSSRVLRDVVYKKAMSELLDEFYREVGCRFGLERETVSGKRFTREQWQRKKILDELREVDVQRRIAEAVSDALISYKLEELERGKAFDTGIDIQNDPSPNLNSPPDSHDFRRERQRN